MPKMEFPLTKKSLTAILRLTRIENEQMKAALHDYLVLGKPQSEVVATHGCSRQQVHTHAKNILENLKPAFDDYAVTVLAHDRKDGR